MEYCKDAEKSDYERARDERVKEMAKLLEPLKIAAANFNNTLARDNSRRRREDLSSILGVNPNPRRSARLQDLRGGDNDRVAAGSSEGTRARVEGIQESESLRMSSSEYTESENEMNLTGDVDSSSDEELQPSLNLNTQKRQKEVPHSAIVSSSGGQGVRGTSHMPPPGYWGPSPWMQPPWMQPSAMQSQQWHLGGGPSALPYHGSWPGASLMEEGCSLEAEGRASRRRKRQRNDTAVEGRQRVGKKPHELVVKAGGEIDNTCEGKNAWDSAVRVSTPRIFDMSVVDWEAQKPASLALLRETLDADFEYVGHSLSVQGFKSAIKKYMKAERARLKAKFGAGSEVCPIHIDPLQWEKLKTYWKTDLQVAKTAKMVQARAHVKDYSTMGRRGRARKELALRKVEDRSPGLTEIADGMHQLQASGPSASNMQGAIGAVPTKLIALEEKQKDMEEKQEDMSVKMTQMLLKVSKTTDSLDEVKSMLKLCMERFSTVEAFSPSIGISAVETQAQLHSAKMQVGVGRPNTQFKTPAAAVSMHVSESSDDFDTLKVGPTAAKAKEHSPSLQEQVMEDALELDALNNNVDLVSTAIPAAISALIHLGDPRPKPRLSSKELAVVIVEEPVVGIVNSKANAAKVVVKALLKEKVKENVEKGVLPQDSAVYSKRASRACKLKKVVERSAEGFPSDQKAASTAVVVELSASGSPEVVPRVLRSSLRKRKVLLKSSMEVKATEQEASGKTKSEKRETKTKAPPKKSQADKFVLGQEVFMLNPKSVKQSVAAGIISGLGGQHQFHFVMIPESFYKVDVKEAIWPQVSLMFPNLDAEQAKVKDAVGSNAIWEGKFLKSAK